MTYCHVYHNLKQVHEEHVTSTAHTKKCIFPVWLIYLVLSQGNLCNLGVPCDRLLITQGPLSVASRAHTRQQPKYDLWPYKRWTTRAASPTRPNAKRGLACCPRDSYKQLAGNGFKFTDPCSLTMGSSKMYVNTLWVTFNHLYKR